MVVLNAFNGSIRLQLDYECSWMSCSHCSAKRFNLELDMCRTGNMKALTFRNITAREFNNAFNALVSSKSFHS